MALFHYIVLNSHGEEIPYSLEAVSADDAKRQLRKRGLIPLRDTVPQVKLSFISLPGIRRKFDLYNFTSRLAPLLAANIPLEKALGVIEESQSLSVDREVIHRLRKGLHEGKSFSALTKEMPDLFPVLYSSLLETGEEAGCLPEVTRELRRFLKESKEFKEFVVTSSIYPVIVVSVTLLVVILLFTVFIPRFAQIFEDLGRDMPLMTKIMLDIGNFMQIFWFIWLILIVAVIYLRKASHAGRLRILKDKIILFIPVVRHLVMSVQVGRFIRTMSIMVKNNVHLLSSVRIARQVIDNEVIKSSFSNLEKKLRSGAKLSASLAESPYMPSGSVAMLKIAEESGEQGEMLERIADEIEEDTKVKVKRLLALMEPAIILFLALIVLAIVLSIFLAIMEMNVIK